MPSYKIVTNGRALEGRPRGEVLAALAQLFKKAPRAVEPLLAGKPVLIKRGLDEQSAHRMAAAITETGLMVRVEPDAEKGAPPSAETRPAIQAAGGDQHAARIVSLRLGATDLRHTVIYCTSLSSSGKSMNFHRPDNMDVHPSEVAAISAYRIVHREEPSDMLMVYLATSPRPLVTNASAIKYWTFPKGTAGPSTVTSLRGLINLILRVNPSALIDEQTARFIENPASDPPLLKKDENALSAALASAIEDAGMFREPAPRPGAPHPDEADRQRNKPTRNERVLQSILSSKPARAEDLPPIRGSLIVLAIALAASLSWNAYSLWRYADMAWTISQGAGPMRFILNYIVLALELIATLALLLMAARAARLMLRRSMIFPLSMATYLKASLAYGLAQYLLPQLLGLARGFGHQLQSYAIVGIGSVIGRSLWRLWWMLGSGLLAYAIAAFVVIRYLKNSERVKETFVGR